MTDCPADVERSPFCRQPHFGKIAGDSFRRHNCPFRFRVEQEGDERLCCLSHRYPPVLAVRHSYNFEDVEIGSGGGALSLRQAILSWGRVQN